MLHIFKWKNIKVIYFIVFLLSLMSKFLFCFFCLIVSSLPKIIGKCFSSFTLILCYILELLKENLIQLIILM